jgi:cobalt-precorrin 5A hydrolase/precorrin-3B C17-methyltransferase
LTQAGLSPLAVGAVATIDLKETEPAVVTLAAELGVPIATFPAEDLAKRQVPNPSEVVEAAVGTPSVAEAAALSAAGPGAVLVVQKQVGSERDAAVARRSGPPGHLAVVGLGPGRASAMTPEATRAIRHADAVLGYRLYLELAGDLLSPAQEIVASPIGAEKQRCLDALARAAAGARVALVCSGDPGIYAMASLVHELAAGAGDPPVTVIPGVTAAQSAAAVLGAPLGHDHAAISLSDLLTPWPTIVSRLKAAASGDFVVTLYNPRSQRRTTQLGEALAILAEGRPAGTPAAVVSSIGRPGQRVVRATVSTLDPGQADMLSVVVVGSSQTRWIGDRMVTPRGYGAAR